MVRTAVIAGAGPGLGESIAQRFASEGCAVGLLARSDDYIEELATELRTGGKEAVSVPTDITDPTQVERAFRIIRDELGEVDVLVNHAGGGGWRGLVDLSPDGFEAAWRTCAFGAFLCSKEVVENMLESGAGTILFTGATSAIRGRADAVGFASGKFAMRGLAESMARELGPQGIHVAHVIIDGQILTPRARESAPDRSEDTYLDPDEIAETYWHLVEQERSSWTLELDLRPHVEEF